MFHFNGDRWSPFKHKITNTVVTINYSDEPSAPDTAVVEDVKLTDVQMERLEAIQFLINVTRDDITRFVLYGESVEDPAIKAAVDEFNRRNAVDNLLSSMPDAALASQAEAIKQLADKWASEKYYKAGKLLTDEGKLYRVKEEHRSIAEHRPCAAPDVYYEVRNGI
ncbi:hypothetical protein NQU17_08160 [Clostridiaceae bacterium HFYG-1003]|nr:hypothetical protein NQU17_08160 [Clostridiaceae bacterium HFYG-1003]